MIGVSFIMSDWVNFFFPAILQIERNKFLGEPIMATVVAQEVQRGAITLLEEHQVPCERFTPNVLGQVPIMATALLAGNSSTIGWDNYNNPFIKTNIFNGKEARVSLAVALVYEDNIFVYNRDGLDLQNLNPKLDVIGSVGFGVSAGPFKWPPEMTLKKIASVRFSDYLAVEHTDGNGDRETVIMPIVVVRLEGIDGFEQHFVPIPEINDAMTAKLQAAILAIQEGI